MIVILFWWHSFDGLGLDLPQTIGEQVGIFQACGGNPGGMDVVPEPPPHLTDNPPHTAHAQLRCPFLPYRHGRFGSDVGLPLPPFTPIAGFRLPFTAHPHTHTHPTGGFTLPPLRATALGLPPPFAIYPTDPTFPRTPLPPQRAHTVYFYR